MVKEQIILETNRGNVDDKTDGMRKKYNISNINELLRMCKLRKDDIVNMYTVEFERQK